MLDNLARVRDDAPSISGADVVTSVRDLSSRELSPLVQQIDADGLYPETVMRAFGRAGAFGTHLPDELDSPDLVTAIRAMSAAGEHCLSTAKRASGGYVVRGLLPYVSNLGDDHYFGAVFEVEDAPKRYVMAVVPCAAEGITLAGNTKFVALDGTRTFTVQMRDVMISDALVLADPSDAYIRRIRAGFVLLQSGMAFGLIRGCIDLMNQAKGPLGHVNKYLDVQPEHLADGLAAMEHQVEQLAATPFDGDPSYWRAVIEARLAAGEASVAAAHAAMLHCGARGYVVTGAAQRRLREAYFVAIVTPAIKQLKKMLADMKH
jgi:hypothetical protein